MATVFPAYPASTLAQAEDLIIFTGNQLGDIVNGDSLSEVETVDGFIPTIRKTLVDNFGFKSPIDWSVGSNETVYNQLRKFTDGSWWWAPLATTSNPIAMTADPYTNTDWKVFTKEQVTTFENTKRLAAEAGYNLVGTFYFGCTVTTATDVVLNERDGRYYSWGGTLPKVVAAGSSPVPISPTEWIDRGSTTLRSELKSTIINSNTSFVFEGDSVTEGNTIGGYKYSDVFKTLRFADKSSSTVNTAVGGSWIGAGENSGNNITDRYETLVRPHRPASNGGDGAENSYLIILIGTNDISKQYGAKTAATIISQLTNYVQNAKADGFIVVVQTILPRKFTSAGWDLANEKTRQEVNQAIKTKTIPADIVADTAGVLVDPYGSLFHDTVHPTVLGSNLIAYYLDGGLMTGDFLVSGKGDALASPVWTGQLKANPGAWLEVGSAYMKTTIGTDNLANTGFLVHENLNPSGVDVAKWQWQAGVDGDTLKLQALNDANSNVKDVFAIERSGMNTRARFGTALQYTYLGLKNGSGAGYLQFKNLWTSVPADAATWEWSCATNSSDVALRCINDAGTNSNPAITFKRSGYVPSGAVVNGYIGSSAPSGSVATTWKLGAVKASGGGNVLNATKYVTVEINGTAVNLAVINDPAISV